MSPEAIATADRLIVALDTATVAEARALVERIGDGARFYKVGLTLLYSDGGMDFARDLVAGGKKLFLDAKLYDVPAQVHGAVENIARIGASFLTIHGDGAIVRAAVEARNGQKTDLKLFAVTVLTSLDKGDIASMGFEGSVGDLVLHRARAAQEAGCDGVICSGQEAGAVRAQAGSGFLIVTPGIRSAGSAQDDQKRVVTPEDAFRAGADHIVMGREIARAEDPRAAALGIRAVAEQVFGG